MDRPAPQPPQHRDIVYCHQCANEWYRDEHGMTPCPECGGEFTEVIEDGHDPRDDLQQPHPLDVPDPDEEDIDRFEWQNNGPGLPAGGHVHGRVTRNLALNDQGIPQALPGGGFGGGGLMGLLGSAVQAALGSAQQGQAPPQQEVQGQETEGSQSPLASPRSPQPGNGGTYIHYASGPGFTYTVRSNVNMNLTPRDANAAQPFQTNPDHLDRMMASMLMNIGGPPGAPPGTFRFGPPPFGRNLDDDFHNNDPFGASPFGNIFRMFGIPPGGVHGDAVYSQEGLDRIITQLMEQHQTGNAPGPATEQAIDTLPTKAISSPDLDEAGKAECTICMDDVPLGETVTVLPCGHWFHFDCIKSWLSEHDTCPHCRQGIMPKEGDSPDASSQRARQPSEAPLHNTLSSEYHGPRDMPGRFPQPSQDVGSGTWQESSIAPSSPGGPGDDQRQSSAGGGLFSRMRDTFGGGGSSGADKSGGRR